MVQLDQSWHKKRKEATSAQMIGQHLEYVLTVCLYVLYTIQTAIKHISSSSER